MAQDFERATMMRGRNDDQKLPSNPVAARSPDISIERLWAIGQRTIAPAVAPRDETPPAEPLRMLAHAIAWGHGTGRDDPIVIRPAM